ncbi:BLUF domain-containing protein [Neptunicoccus sediminis]|uniref:BLUF domain-containing protein n=1 Tax=Neptunicoccus sediminis TaxID=1892596 RepID=UPI000845EE63|nr:BLUF domain-containing protein [Neptunicoccus sediminis]
MLKRLHYESRITGRLGPLALLTLQKKCVRRNIESGITSFLFVDRQRIFQVLEGETEDVDATMERIASHRMHKDIKVRAIMRCSERKFTSCPFGVTTLHDAEFKRVMNAGMQRDFFKLDVLQAERFLGIIASRKRRALRPEEFEASARRFHSKAAGRTASSAAHTPQGGKIYVPGHQPDKRAEA